METEIAIFEKPYFTKVWDEDIMTQHLLLKRSIIQAQQVFSCLSELTVMSLVSELFKEKTYKKGEIILYQSVYSPTLKITREYFKSHDNSKFAEKIKAKKVSMRKGTIKHRTGSNTNSIDTDRKQANASNLSNIS